jgi:hypothetical protein
MNFKKTLLGGLCFVLSACAGQQIDHYAENSPKLDLRKYLNGDLEAWGVLHGRDGTVKRTFTVSMKASWKGNDGVLEEHFVFNDGEKSSRTWKVHYDDNEHFTATAHDVVGTAKGVQKGNAANMSYTLRVPVDGKEYDIRMDDWLYLVDGKRLINRTDMRKFGVSVGTLSIAFEKK